MASLNGEAPGKFCRRRLDETDPAQVKKKSISDRKEHEIRIAAPLFVPATKNGALFSKFREEAKHLA